MPESNRGAGGAQQLRAQAQKIRRAAAIPKAEGRHSTAVLMLAVAETLERDAAQLEREAPKG